MKKLIGGLIAAILVAVLVFGTGVGITGASPAGESNPAPTVTVRPTVVELHSKTQLVILGVGFEPGQELAVLLQHADGTVSDITFAVDPETVADEKGNFATLFTVDRFERIMAEGVFAFIVTDLNYNALATAPIGFADPAGRSRVGIYPRKAPNYEKNPDDPRPLPWTAPFFEYPERPE